MFGEKIRISECNAIKSPVFELREKSHLKPNAGSGTQKADAAARLAAADDLLEAVEFDFAREMAEQQATLYGGQNGLQTVELELKTKALEDEIDQMLEALVEKRLEEAGDVAYAARESRAGRRTTVDRLIRLVKAAANGEEEEEGEDHSERERGEAETSNRAIRCPPSLPSSSLYSKEENIDNGRFGRSTEFYKIEQDAIRSTMDVREQLLLNNRRKSPSHSDR